MKNYIYRAVFSIIVLGGLVLGSPSMVAKGPGKEHSKASIKLSLPNGAISVAVGKEKFHYHKGVYYKKTPRGYQSVKGPRGAVIRSLPRGYVRVVHKGKTYYRFNGVYYQNTPGGFIIVSDPTPTTMVAPTEPVVTGTLIEEVDSFTVWRDNEEFLFKEGQFFKSTPNGLVWVEPPYDSVSSMLPTGSVSVWYQENEYYDSDGVYFKKTPVGYKVIPPPWEGS